MMTDIVVQALTANEHGPILTNDTALSAADKQQILADWQRFWAGGFRQLYFNRALYRFLVHACSYTVHQDQATFYRTFFGSESLRLRLFINQFAGDKRSAEYGTTAWLDGPAADLKQALCRTAEPLFAPLSQVLDDLEFKHAELGRVWREFALSTGLPDPGYPPHYQISENSRNLLTYAAAIALRRGRPLQGLQVRFPDPWLEQVIPAAEPVLISPASQLK
jgi:hypothetical protein